MQKHECLLLELRTRKAEPFCTKFDAPLRIVLVTGLDSKSRSSSFSEANNRSEAALRAQLIELRRELSSSQQEVEKSRHDLQQRQELLRSAAGIQDSVKYTSGFWDCFPVSMQKITAPFGLFNAEKTHIKKIVTFKHRLPRNISTHELFIQG